MKNIHFEKPNFKELKKKYLLVDMHSHTEASHDCNTPIKDFGTKFKELGIGVSITDHNSIKGALAYKRMFPKQFIIPGIEVTTSEDKDILFYFHSFSDLIDFQVREISPKIKSHRTNAFVSKTLITNEELLDIAKDYNAFRVLPHPLQRMKGIYRSLLKKNDFSILKKVEAIEVLNSTMFLKANLTALVWAHIERMPMTGGSDAHILKTLGGTVTAARAETVDEFLEKIRKKQNKVYGTPNRWRDDMKGLVTITKNKLKKSKRNLS